MSISTLPRGWTAWVITFGLLLGVGLLKFGNPIILDHQIPTPATWSAAWTEPWPAFWGWIGLATLAIWSLALGATDGRRPKSGWRGWRAWLPLGWIFWQGFSALHSVDTTLSRPTLAHFAGVALTWWFGIYWLPRGNWPRWILIGILAAATLCLVRAVNQRWGGFHHDREILLEGERTGWTNFSTAELTEMRKSGMIFPTNGAFIANPIILLKLERARVNGTLVYPNALAGAILLLLPSALLLSVHSTSEMRPIIRSLVIGLTSFLGLGCLFWTGSKSAWLIGMGLFAIALWRRPWSARLRGAAVALIITVGLIAFGLRFQAYFSAGATSVSARFDYWKVAVKTLVSTPWTGTGPGTFMRPYATLKSPEAEMTRLVHNDYLEQFSDSGFPGGVLYLAWIGLGIWTSGRNAARCQNPLIQTLWLGTVGWFAQGMVEFGLYIPGLAWIGFAFLGALTSVPGSDLANGPRRNTPEVQSPLVSRASRIQPSSR